MHDSTTWRSAVVVALIGLALPIAPAMPQAAGAPPGWHSISLVGEYMFGTDTVVRTDSHASLSATIRSVSEYPQSAAFLQQSIRADHYRGRRVRLKGYLRTAAVEGAGLWMHVDNDSVIAASDYMEHRSLSGDTDWRQYSVILDVPADARGLTFGAYLNGSGQVWIDELKLDVVGDDVATTGHAGGLHGGHRIAAVRVEGPTSTTYRDERALPLYAYADAPAEPVNLDFQEDRGPVGTISYAKAGTSRGATIVRDRGLVCGSDGRVAIDNALMGLRTP